MAAARNLQISEIDGIGGCFGDGGRHGVAEHPPGQRLVALEALRIDVDADHLGGPGEDASSNDLDVDRSYFMTRIILGRGIAPSF